METPRSPRVTAALVGLVLALVVAGAGGCRGTPSRPSESPEIRQKRADLRALREMALHAPTTEVYLCLMNTILFLQDELNRELGREGTPSADLPQIALPPTGTAGSAAWLALESTRWRLAVVEAYEDSAIRAASPETRAALHSSADAFRAGLSEWLGALAGRGVSVQEAVPEWSARAVQRSATIAKAIRDGIGDPAALKRAEEWWRALPQRLETRKDAP